MAIDSITKNLPLLYINYFKLSPKQIEQKKKEYANTATHVLVFPMALPALGFNTYVVSASQEDGESETQLATSIDILETDPGTTVGNEFYELTIDAKSGMPASLTNKKSNVTSDFNIEWGWYQSSEGTGSKLQLYPYL